MKRWRRARVSGGVLVTLCVVMLIGGSVLVWRHVRPVRARAERMWYYDPANDRLFVANGLVPPIQGPSDSPGGEPSCVRAYVFACGNDSGSDERIIGWLETFPKECERKGTYAELGGDFPFDTTVLVKRARDSEWVKGSSDEGRRIRAEVQGVCGDKAPVEVVAE